MDVSASRLGHGQGHQERSLRSDTHVPTVPTPAWEANGLPGGISGYVDSMTDTEAIHALEQIRSFLSDDGGVTMLRRDATPALTDEEQKELGQAIAELDSQAATVLRRLRGA
jgi:hypothetical protein